MKQKIKGRLYRCGNLKDHCLCPLFNCCIWSFEAAYPLPPSARSPPGWRPPWGQGTLGDSSSNGSAAGTSCFQDSQATHCVGNCVQGWAAGGR